LQAVEPDDVAVVIAVDGPSLNRTLDAVKALNLIRTRLLVVADERVVKVVKETAAGATVFQVAQLTEALSPLATTIRLQLLAAVTADLRGTNADDFRCGDPRFSRIYAELVL
jgi:glucosamine 6-phosphate synthetase-like amidotransferase/phosphosugar isomerase protein